MDAVKFIEERNRMCGTMSEVWDAAQIVKNTEEWAAAHPRKTRQSVFLEQWPEAIVGDNGVLAIDSCKVEKTIKCNGMDCSKCRREFWMQEVE